MGCECFSGIVLSLESFSVFLCGAQGQRLTRGFCHLCGSLGLSHRCCDVIGECYPESLCLLWGGLGFHSDKTEIPNSTFLSWVSYRWQAFKYTSCPCLCVCLCFGAFPVVIITYRAGTQKLLTLLTVNRSNDLNL